LRGGIAPVIISVRGKTDQRRQYGNERLGKRMSMTGIIESTDKLTIGEAMDIVIPALKGQSLVVPLGADPLPDGTLAMMVSRDNRDLTWIHLYSSEQQLDEAKIGAPAFRWIPFDQILAIVNKPGYGGIMIDVHKPSGGFLIPHEYFPYIATYLAQ
jgi:hypothetical protein